MRVVAPALVFLGVFAAITLSVVHARRPIDGAVARSFNAAIVHHVHRGDVVVPRGCRKSSVDFYFCLARVRSAGHLSSDMLRYVLWLRDNGCWRLYYTDPRYAHSPAYTGVAGCTAR